MGPIPAILARPKRYILPKALGLCLGFIFMISRPPPIVMVMSCLLAGDQDEALQVLY